jgi:hypothetical protein
MKARTLALFQSLRQTIAVVESYPDLRAHAAESKAFELFVAVVDHLAALQHEQATSRLELKELNARKRALAEEVHLLIAGLCATAALLPRNATQLPAFAPPSLRLSTSMFSLEARGIIDLTAKHSGAFIACGLHPHTFDLGRDLIAQLVQADHLATYAEAHARSFNNRLKYAIGLARQRRKQLHYELRRAVTADSRAALRAAASLGRTHRPKLLPGAPAQKLLAAPDSPPSPGAGGMKRLARRVRLRLTRGDTV